MKIVATFLLLPGLALAATGPPYASEPYFDPQPLPP